MKPYPLHGTLEPLIADGLATKSLGARAAFVEGDRVVRCRGLVGCVFALGCAIPEKPPAVVITAPPPTPASLEPSSAPAPAPVTSTEASAERLEAPRPLPTTSANIGESEAQPSPSPQDLAELGQELEREFRGLDLLERAGEGRCVGSADSEQHSECVLAEMERMVTELAPACAGKSGQAQHQCIIDEVFRQLGP